MTFSLTPTYSLNPMVTIEHNDVKLNYPIGSIINRRLREPIKEDKVFTILNAYIEYKGKEFQDKLFNTIVESTKTIELEAFKLDLEPFPTQAFHNILDFFNLKDIIDFIEKTKIVTPLKRLGTKFDKNIELNEKGTRIQTYLKKDYTELIALITALKSIFGIMGLYASIKSELLDNNPYKEYILLQLIITHPITKSDAFVKVYLSIEKLVERVMSDTTKSIIRVLEKNISKSAIPVYIMGKVIIERLFTNNELEDTDNKSIITKIYKYASNQLKSKSDVSSIKIKYYNQGSDDGESESNLESLRTPSNITVGNIQEYRAYAQMPFKIMKDMGMADKIPEFKRLHKIFKETFSLYLPLQKSIYIASWVLKNVMDPRCILYFKIDELINILTIAYIKIKDYELYAIAALLVGYQTQDNNLINTSLYVNKLDPFLKEQALQYYPYQRVIITGRKRKEESYIEEVITKIFKDFSTISIKTSAEEEVVKKANNGIYSPDFIMPPDIKNQFLKLFIRLAEDDEILYNKNKELKSKKN